jgi:histidinol-phosphate phosphatase family protein
MKRRAVFLDRDGTLGPDRHFLADPDEFEFFAGTPSALASLTAIGLDLVVVTNQSGVGRGYFSLATVHAVHDHMQRLLLASGVQLAGIYVCPHGPDDGCACRKPRAGLLDRAARELGIDLSASYMVGDRSTDIVAGARAGCRTVWLTRGESRQAPRCPQPDVVVPTIDHAAAAIVAELQPLVP